MEPSLLNRVKTAVDNGVGSDEARAKNQFSKPVQQVFAENFGGNYRAEEAMKSTIAKNVALQKALGTVDIGSLRLVSISDRTVVKRNTDTLFLNFLESRDSKTITDYQYRIKERDILTDVAPVVNVDSTSIFPIIQSARTARYNTLTTVGNSLKVSFMASNIASQQADVNLLEEEMDDELVRIRRTFSRLLLANVEQVVESASQLPQMGGFLTRSTLNAQNAGGSNLTNTILQTAVNVINSTLGRGRSLMLWGSPNQEPIIRDLAINRFPGSNADSFYNMMNRLDRERLAKFNVPVDVLYSANPGGAIPWVSDYQMDTVAANTALLFDGDLPRLARFKMDGQVGPFVLARPEQTLYELVAMFDIMTLDDPQQVSRIKITNLAS